MYSVRSTIGVLINTYQIEPEAVCFAITTYGNGMKGSWLRRVHGNQDHTGMWLTLIVFRLLQPLDSDTDLAFSFSCQRGHGMVLNIGTSNATSNYSTYSSNSTTF